MQLIALVGFKGSGKDTAGQHLVQNHGFVNFSFAESLKDALASIFCWDRAMLEGATPESRIWRETVDQWWSQKLGIPDFTPRLAMQLVGTNVFREHFNPDLWIMNIERKITLLPPDSKVVLCDGRFPNELNLGRSFGGRVIRVKRGDEPEWYEQALIANGFVTSGKLWDKLYHKLSYGMHLGFFDEFVSPSSPGAMQAFAKHLMPVHESEWAWIGQPLDVTIENDGTIGDLTSAIEAWA